MRDLLRSFLRWEFIFFDKAFIGPGVLFTVLPLLSVGAKSQNSDVCGFQEHWCQDDQGTCIHQRFWCDGQFNCPNGFDESDQMCTHHSGVFLKYSAEIAPSGETNNMDFGITECILQDYPSGCNCSYGDLLVCEKMGLRSVPQNIGPGAFLSKLRLSMNNIEVLPKKAFAPYPNLTFLNLSMNAIQVVDKDAFEGLVKLRRLIMEHNQISWLEPGTFSDLPHLQILYLQHNFLTDFDAEVFRGAQSIFWLDLRHNRIQLRKQNMLEYLRSSCRILELDFNNVTEVTGDVLCGMSSLTLSLAHNRIHSVSADAFRDCQMDELILAGNGITQLPPNIFNNQMGLRDLDLSGNPLAWLPEDVFHPLTSLKSLNLTGVEIHNISRKMFTHPSLQISHIYFGKFIYCSYAPLVRDCFPKTDGISTDENLLDSDLLKVSGWVIAALAIFFNVFVLTARGYLWRGTSQLNKVHSLCISTLAASDLLMGVYMFIISAADESYRSLYHLYSHHWMTSHLCHFSGFISVISTEVSTLLLLFMAVERYYRIIWKPFASVGAANLLSTAFWIGACWCLGLVTATIPLVANLDSDGVQSFYGQNGVCLPLFIHDPFLKGWTISAFIFVMTPLIAIIAISYCYSTIFFHVEKSRQASDRNQADKRHLKKVLAITISNNASWLTIITIKILAMVDVKIPGKIYGWMAVFILPVNCCLNPIIYTLMTPEFASILKQLPWNRRREEVIALRQLASYASIHSSSRNSFIKRPLQTTYSGTTLSSRIPSHHHNSLRGNSTQREEIRRATFHSNASKRSLQAGSFCRDVPEHAKFKCLSRPGSPEKNDAAIDIGLIMKPCPSADSSHQSESPL